jgi:hypothetical protein
MDAADLIANKLIQTGQQCDPNHAGNEERDRQPQGGSQYIMSVTHG